MPPKAEYFFANHTFKSAYYTNRQYHYSHTERRSYYRELDNERRKSAVLFNQISASEQQWKIHTAKQTKK